MAQNFELVEYEVGSAIIEQGSLGESTHSASAEEKNMYYYILMEGECVVVKDGKQVHGPFGSIEKGTFFGEGGVISKNTVRTATIIASKAPPRTGAVVLYRLNYAFFLEMMGEEEIAKLRERMLAIMCVVDTLSGVDTKLKQGSIIRPYQPESLWLWKQWRGTVLQYVWRWVLGMMIFTALIGIVVSLAVGDWALHDIESYDYYLLDQLRLIGGMWERLTTFLTFVLSFFLSEAFKFWKRFYWTTRGIQGRFNDLSLVLASNAARNDDDGKLTEGAIAALDDIARLQKLMHQLFWCSVVKRFRCLLSPEGISYLLSQKLITLDEYASLIEVGEHKLGAHHACQTWLLVRVNLAVKKGDINNNSVVAFYNIFYDKLTNLRMLMARIPDMYDGRMPLAYVHFVNLLGELCAKCAQ